MNEQYIIETTHILSLNKIFLLKQSLNIYGSKIYLIDWFYLLLKM